MKEHNRFKNSLKLIATCLSCLLFAGWADNLEQVRKTAKGIRTVSTAFVQEKHLKILDKPLISRGRCYFCLPQSLRWEYISPVKSILLMHNREIKKYVQSGNTFSLENGASLDAMRVFLQEITNWIQGKFENKDFNVVLKTGKTSKIILTPKEKYLFKIINRIELQLSRRPGVISSVKILESGESYTLIKFYDVQINKDIKEKIFTEI